MGPAWAGDARILRDSGPGDVVVEANDATLDQVIEVLATRFAFAVDHAAEANATARFTGRLQGSLDRILERVLRHEGHLIVHSAESSTGISRVILLAPKRGGPAVTTTIPTAETPKELADGSVTPDGAANRPIAPSPPPPAYAPSPSTSQGPAATPPAPPAQITTDPTLRQLEEIGRQMMSADPSRAIDAQLQSPAAGLGASAISQTADGGLGDSHELTQRALANVQSLVSSLRAVCLGRSCAH
jgi:hypothetical protein